MPRELDEIQRIARADRVHELLGNDHVIAALAAIETRWLNAIRRSQPAQTKEREQAYAVLRGLDEFVTELTKLIQDGTVAKVQAAEAESNAQ